MRKQFKSIVAAILAVLMLMSISMTAVAAEQVPARKLSEVSLQKNTKAVVPDAGMLPSTKFTASKGQSIGKSVEIAPNATTIEHRLVGNSGSTRGQWVNFRIVNKSTGATRSFTAIADGEWRSDTYLSAISPGNYDVEVINAGAYGSYSLTLRIWT